MLSQEALQHIEDNNTAREIHQTNSSKLSALNLLMLPKSYDLKNLEPYGLAPNLYRAEYTTNSLPDFINYVQEYGTEASQLFIDPNTMSARCIIDMGCPEQPKWGYHNANLNLPITHEFNALVGKNGHKHNQQDFIDFLLDHENFIVFHTESGDEVGFKEGLRAIRRLTITDYKQRLEEIGSLEINSQATRTTSVKSGEQTMTDFILHTSGYEGLGVQSVNCQIRYYPDGDGLKIAYRINALEQIKKQMSENFKISLYGDFSPENELEIFIGTVKTGA